MLQSIRDGVKGWIAYVIVGFIAVPFLFIGGYSYFTGSGGAVVAEVDGVDIDRQRLDQVYRQQRDRLAEMFGGSLPDDMYDEAALRRESLDRIINQTLLYGFVGDKGLRVSDQELAHHIRNQEAFQVDGRFSRERYEMLLQRNRMTTDQYEALVRRDLLVDQLQEAVMLSTVVSEAQLDRYISLIDQRRSFAYAKWPASALLEEVEVTDAEVETRYEAHLTEYMRPEAVRVAYVELTPEALGERARITEDELRAYYRETRGRYGDGGRREARHILIQLGEDPAEGEVEQARALALDLRQRIEQGESFEELADAHSDDAGSARRGGMLGWLERGDTVEPFEEALFSLDEGELSDPVRSPFGYHLIFVEGVEAGDAPDFEEVRDEVRRDLLRAEVGAELFEMADELANIAFEQPAGLEPAADALGLEIRTSDWIPRDGAEEGLAGYPQVVEAAFHEDVLEHAYNSDLIELADDRFLVLRLHEHRPAAPEPLEAVADEIRETLRRQAAGEIARQRAEALAEALEEGADWDEAVAGQGGDAGSAELVGRGDSRHPPAVVERAFTLGEGAGAVVTLNDAGAAYVRLDAIEPGDPDALDADERRELRQQLLAAGARAEFDGLIEAMRAEANIRIREDRL